MKCSQHRPNVVWYAGQCRSWNAVPSANGDFHDYMANLILLWRHINDDTIGPNSHLYRQTSVMSAIKIWLMESREF